MAAGTTLLIRCGQVAVNGSHSLSLANAAEWVTGKLCGFVRRVTRLPLSPRVQSYLENVLPLQGALSALQWPGLLRL